MNDFKTNSKYYPIAVNRNGDIKNLETGNIRKQSIGKNGYAYIGTRTHGSLYTHRLVAEIFVGNPGKGYEVNHINGIKTDNRLENLEWVTRKQNMIHAAKNGLLNTRNRARGGDCNLSEYTEEEIRKVFSLLEDGLRNSDVAKKTGIPVSYVKTLRAGKSWAHIYKEYRIPTGRRDVISEETVRWICRQIVSGKGNTQILKECRSKNVNINIIKNIKYKNSHVGISSEYF